MRSCTRIVGAAALAFAALLPSLAKADACEDPFHLADRAKVIEPCSARLADHDLTKDQRIRALEYRARGSRAAKRDDDALADIEAGLALAEDAALYTVRAGIKRDRYNLEGAWEDGQRATHLEPDKVRHYEILINIAVFVHDFENAKALIDHATSLDDGNVALMIWRSFYHRHKGEAREAIGALDEALASPRSGDRKAFGIDWYGRRRDTDIVLRLLRGETLRQRHDWEKAANAIEEAVAFATNEVTLTERAYSKINSPMASGGMVGAEALADTDAALQLDPTYDRAHLTRGLALQVLKRPQEALVELDKAVALAASSFNHRQRAWVRRELGEVDGTVRDLLASIEAEPERFDQVAQSLGRLGYLLDPPEQVSRPALMVALKACAHDTGCFW